MAIKKEHAHAVGNSKQEKTCRALRLRMATKPITNAGNFD
jgi:hypothetical protein